MSRQLHPGNLDISLIDFEDFSYSISPDGKTVPEKSLLNSIAAYGIIHPPVVRKKGPGSYAIVSGRTRLHAWSSIFPERQACVCMLFPEEAPDIDVFSYLLEEILVRRKLTLIEKALFLQKVSPLTEKKLIAEKFLSRLGFSAVDPSQISRTLKLLELEPPLIQALHQGELHEAVARDILSLSSSDRLAVYRVISALKIGMNYQKRLLMICRELAGRQQRTIVSLLDDAAVQEILNHRESNPPQKTKNLMNLLMRKYRPRSSSAEDAFKRYVASLKLPQNVSITHTPSFEDDFLALSITLTDKKSLENILPLLKNAIRNPSS